MVSKGFPNVTTSGQQCIIGEKHSVILKGHQNHIFFYRRVPENNFSLNMVLEKLKLNLINISM